MIELIEQGIDFIIHIDQHLSNLVSVYQTWTILIIALIIFCETGLVVTPLLPGDSLLFAAGAISALNPEALPILLLVPIIFLAAMTGDNTNYFIGRFLGKKVYEKNYRLIKREYLNKTHDFYEKHGGKTIIIARFMPIVRTFAPFVAGVGAMKYKYFLLFCIIGNLLWVNIFLWAGHQFGNFPVIKRNFELVIFAIIIISLLPPVFAFIKEKYGKKRNSSVN